MQEDLVMAELDIGLGFQGPYGDVRTPSRRWLTGAVEPFHPTHPTLVA